MPEKDILKEINRRRILKATGAMAGAMTLGSTSFVDVASAAPPAEIRFCGCSQVCVSSGKSYRIVYTREEDNEYWCRVAPGTDEMEPRTPDCYTAGKDEKIIGVLGGSRYFYYNPNTCAEAVLNEVNLNDCGGCKDNNCDSTVSYNQVGKHEYHTRVVWGEGDSNSMTVTVRTRLCKPPAEWQDEPNGPPEKVLDRSGRSNISETNNTESNGRPDESDSSENNDNKQNDRSDESKSPGNSDNKSHERSGDSKPAKNNDEKNSNRSDESDSSENNDN
jgi:hypothetical protein